MDEGYETTDLDPGEARYQDLIQAIDSAESSSYGSEVDSELARERALSIDAYLGRNLEPDEEGLSQVVDRSVFETVQWMLPSFTRIFCSGDNIVEFSPLNEDDEQGASQESDYLNYLVTQKNNWFELVMTWCQDALLTKNSYMLCQMEEKHQVESEQYKGQSLEGVMKIQEGDGVEIIGQDQYPDPSGQMEPVVDPMTGQPAIDPMTGQPAMQPRMLYDILIKRTKPTKNLKFRVLAPERCKVSEKTESFRLDDCSYFEFYDFVSISDLRCMGFDVPDDIPSDGRDPDDEEEDARDQFHDIDTDDDAAYDPAMRRVRCRYIWIKFDFDQDGYSEMQYCVVVGSQVLFREECTRIPVSCIVPSIMPHRHMGLSIADMVFDIQRIRTAILRQGLNNLYLSNNQRHVISDRVDLDSMMTSAPGGLVQLDPGALPSEGHVQALETPFVFPQAMQGLELMDQIRETRTGMNRLFQGVDENVVSETASGVAQLSSMAAQRIEQIARIFASGFEYIFSVAHELILKHGMQAEKVKLRGEWVDIDPSTWRHGRDLRIVAPVGAGNKDAQVARIMQILKVQEATAAAGGRTVQEDNIYAAQMELAKQMDYISPDKFFTDPAVLGPPPDVPTEVEIAAETERYKVDTDERIKQADLIQKDIESSREAQIAVYRSNLEAEVRLLIEEGKRNGTIDVERLRSISKMAPIPVGESNIGVGQAFGRTQQSVTDLGEIVGEALDGFREAIDALKEAQSAPKRIVKDREGKPIGVETIQ